MGRAAIADETGHLLADCLRNSEHLGALALGTALGLTSATQLRAPLLPVGPGEVLLLLWLAGSVFALVRGGRIVVTELVRPIVAFWLFTLGALALGWCCGIYLNLWDPGSTRDAIAVVLAAAVASVSTVQPKSVQRIWVASGALAITLVLGLGFLLAMVGLGKPVVGPVTSMYGFRFAGWALNPNQAALAVTIVPFVAWEHGRLAHSARARVAWTLVAIGGFGIGIATLSDALVLGWGAAAAIATGLWWWRTTFLLSPSRWRKLMAVFGIPLLAAAGLAVIGPRLMEIAEEKATSSYDDGGQGSDRVARWAHGIDAAARSPIVGLGPGSYSGPFKAFEGEEAHNTLIDWLDATGIVGLAALLALWGWVGFRVRVSGRAGAGAAFCGLIVFSMFHFVLRQPVFWFFLVILAAPLPLPLRVAHRRAGVR